MATLPLPWVNPYEKEMAQLREANAELARVNELLKSGIDCVHFCAQPVCLKSLYAGHDRPDELPF